MLFTRIVCFILCHYLWKAIQSTPNYVIQYRVVTVFQNDFSLRSQHQWPVTVFYK